LKEERERTLTQVLPVTRSKQEAKRSYDGLSGVYDYLSGPFEHRHTEKTIGLLSPGEGDLVLEIGFGTGRGLYSIAGSVGAGTNVVGLDLSSGMTRRARKRLERSDIQNVCLCIADAAQTPYRIQVFDSTLVSFTLELFDTPEIPVVLGEIRRVLISDGRIGVVCLSKESGESLSLRLYEWGHRMWPALIDCRPIYGGRFLTDVGFRIVEAENPRMMGLPLEIVVAEKSGTKPAL
jgi:demethylmenaquinone methyltransferase/2-methoxy-6-polyprenyl-1,4-benzoquinol methylase